MKKIALLSIVLMFTAWNVSMAQISPKNNPIPSFDFPLYNSTANFQEQPGIETFEKRDANVVITSTYDNNGEESNSWVSFSNKHTGEILGPFNLSLNEQLTVTLTKGTWTAAVSSESSVKVSIWVDKEQATEKGTK